MSFYCLKTSVSLLNIGIKVKGLTMTLKTHQTWTLLFLAATFVSFPLSHSPLMPEHHMALGAISLAMLIQVISALTPTEGFPSLSHVLECLAHREWCC